MLFNVKSKCYNEYLLLYQSFPARAVWAWLSGRGTSDPFVAAVLFPGPGAVGPYGPVGGLAGWAECPVSIPKYFLQIILTLILTAS
jgi:hypothetical protein